VTSIARFTLPAGANPSALGDVIGTRAIIAAFALMVGAFVIGLPLGAPTSARTDSLRREE
jgi:hypothetical protein